VHRKSRRVASTAILILVAAWTARAAADSAAIEFADAGTSWGLTDALHGIMAHAAACGDFDNDGDLDLFVGNFSDRPSDAYEGGRGPIPNLLLLNEGRRFRPADEPAIAIRARTSGAVFADLDNDGDLDLYVTNNSKRRGLRAPNQLLANEGADRRESEEGRLPTRPTGAWRDVSAGNGACPIMGGRSIGVLDADGDGLLDLLVAEDKWAGSQSRLFRNLGGLQFEDVSARAGLPESLPGLGVVTPDLNLDGRPDLFVSQANRLFLSRADGAWREGDSAAFQYAPVNGEDSPAGVACADLDRDGDLDIVVVDHGQPARQHVFLNEGLREGEPRFREVSVAVGVGYRFPSWTADRVHLKHAHVEIADLDNDGWPDICVAATFRDGDRSRPFVCRNLGVRDGLVRFAAPPVQQAEAYFPAGPIADYDRDGRLDVFFASWRSDGPSRFFLNRSPQRHWIDVRVVGRTINRMGIGARVSVYEAGKAGERSALLGCREVGIGDGFCTGHEAVCHFGLDDRTRCDVEVTLPFGRAVIRRRDVAADQVLSVSE